MTSNSLAVTYFYHLLANNLQCMRSKIKQIKTAESYEEKLKARSLDGRWESTSKIVINRARASVILKMKSTINGGKKINRFDVRLWQGASKKSWWNTAKCNEMCNNIGAPLICDSLSVCVCMCFGIGPHSLPKVQQQTHLQSVCKKRVCACMS